MSRFLHVLGWQLSSEAIDIRLGQWLCYAAAPAVLLVTGLRLTQLPVSQGEALLGYLTSAAVALLLVILGIVLPLAQRKRRPCNSPAMPVD
jgi:hypothetical protein